MKAEEAKKITKENQIGLNEVLNIIQQQAKTGRSVAMFDNMHYDAFKGVVELGYKVSKFTDPIGITAIRVEW